MKLSTETLTKLKNFAGINKNIVLGGSERIRTMSDSKTIMAVADIEEDLPGPFGIYDLNEFLSILNMTNDPDVEISTDLKYATVRSGRSRVKYFFAEPSSLTAPTKDVPMPSTDVEFFLSQDMLNQIRKAASALGVGELVVVGEEGKPITLRVVDTQDPTSNTFELELEEIASAGYELIFSISNFRFVSDGFDVQISSRLISQFAGETSGITYYVALEKNSRFDG